MKANVGGIDRILRIVAGVVLVGLAATGTVGAWGWIGVVPLLTGAVDGATIREPTDTIVQQRDPDIHVQQRARG